MANDDAFEAALTAGDTRAESVDSAATHLGGQVAVDAVYRDWETIFVKTRDRKSTRLNSSHRL